MQSPRKRDQGFTLIEVMIVLAVIGLLFSLVGVNVIRRWHEAQIRAAHIQISSFAESLETYLLHNNGFPTTAQGLRALVEKPTGDRVPEGWSGPYLNLGKIPADPWGTAYRYENTGGKFKICSAGPDQEPGTDDDICSP